jgi:hypothetical protein
MKTIEPGRDKLEETLGNRKTSSVHGLSELGSVKMVILQNHLQIQCNSHQNLTIILHRNRKKSIQKFIWKHKDQKYQKQFCKKKKAMPEVLKY